VRKFSLTLLLIFAASSVALASSTVLITFTALPGTQGNGSANSSQGSTYNGDSIATVAGIPNEDLVCDDFNATTDMPSSAIDFNVNTLSTLASTDSTSAAVDFSAGTLPGGTVGALSQTVTYEVAAVLTSEIEQLPVNTASSQEIDDLQYALWYLMEPSGSDGGILDSPLDTASGGGGGVNASVGATADLKTAYNDVAQTGTTNLTATQVTTIEKELVIYTPTAPVSSSAGQEFLGLSTPQATPEPSTWLLMAALGLLLCVPRMRSRLRIALSRN
jgi:hypothetical protein